MFTILKEHRGFGKQILLLAKNELIKTYKGAVIGPLWAVVKPAFTIFVYWFAFSCGIKQLKTLHLDIGGAQPFSIDFFTFMFIGIIPWFFIQDGLIGGTNSLLEYNYLVKKVVFNIRILPVVKVFSAIFVHCFFLFINSVCLFSDRI